jgi:hypothetical protein
MPGSRSREAAANQPEDIEQERQGRHGRGFVYALFANVRHAVRTSSFGPFRWPAETRAGDLPWPVVIGRRWVIGWRRIVRARSVVSITERGWRSRSQPDRRGCYVGSGPDHCTCRAERPCQGKWRARRVVLGARARQWRDSKARSECGQKRNCADMHWGASWKNRTNGRPYALSMGGARDRVRLQALSSRVSLGSATSLCERAGRKTDAHGISRRAQQSPSRFRAVIGYWPGPPTGVLGTH